MKTNQIICDPYVFDEILEIKNIKETLNFIKLADSRDSDHIAIDYN